MTETIQHLEQFMRSGVEYLSRSSDSSLTDKLSFDKWSKKEILGHLIDSAINNLQRFTEIQYENKPYKVRKYNQDELVKVNNYQEAKMDELIQLWIALNQRIVKVMESQTEQTLIYEIQLPDGASSDLRFLMVDYVDHLEYHLKKIMN